LQDFNFKHLSAGDLLREEQDRSESQYGSLIKESISAGEIIPAHITCGLLVKVSSELQALKLPLFVFSQKPAGG